ncbi:MAG: alpha/beta fold hydrolase [Acidobacteriota bacterium]
MNTIHRWFRSGGYSLMGHIDPPETPSERLGVLMVPPFGWEDVSSYRPLRFVARTLAENGWPVLRFDLPGTGDSSGSALDSGLLDAWIQSVDDAAAELRAATGVKDVVVLGIRLGALLAVSAAGRGANLQDLVLWGPAASGRAMLRELRAFGRLERIEFADGDDSPPQPIPGLEIGGFLIAPETQAALEALALSGLPDMRGRRALLLTRDGLPPDAKLVRVLEASGCAVEVGAGSGFSAMMALPHEAVPPAETGRLIVEFLSKNSQRPPREEQSAGLAATGVTERSTSELARAAITSAGARVSETIYTVNHSGNSLFGLLAEPNPSVQPATLCVLFLNAGSVRHIGPNRMWVEAARRWATQGVPSLRLDLEGIGESDGERTLGTEGLYRERTVEQIEIAMDSLRSRLGVQSFAVIGLCSGAFWAFHAVVRNRDIRAAILLNPRLFFWDPEVDRRRLLWRTVKGLSEWGDWYRLASGDVPLERLKQVARMAFHRIQGTHRNRQLQIQPEAMAQAWAAIDRNRSRVTLVFSEGEPLVREMEEEDQMPPASCSRVRCLRVGNGGHTFRPLWAQKVAHELIDSELCEALRESAPDSIYGGWEKQCAVSETRHA